MSASRRSIATQYLLKTSRISDSATSLSSRGSIADDSVLITCTPTSVENQFLALYVCMPRARTSGDRCDQSASHKVRTTNRTLTNLMELISAQVLESSDGPYGWPLMNPRAAQRRAFEGTEAWSTSVAIS